MQKFDLFKGHNSKMVNAIQLDIKLDQNCMSVNNLGKYGDDPIKNIQVQRADKGKMYNID